MPRSNSSVPRHRRHRKVVKQAKGYYGTRSRNFRTAMDAIIKAMSYAYRDRRQRKRQHTEDRGELTQRLHARHGNHDTDKHNTYTRVPGDLSPAVEPPPTHRCAGGDESGAHQARLE
ncbi:MAG: 50S ribosomal protein L20, partial [Candidatus Marinimicrobia bacterium]|nr:50S ribosomal protein L20 [Candidatus Neomarinimicrobiota bacterium]